jgi:hypothetical protein
MNGPVKVTSRAMFVIKLAVLKPEPDPVMDLINPGFWMTFGIPLVVDDDDPQSFDCRTPEEALAFARRVTVGGIG